MSRTLKNGQLYIQEDHHMFISPTPLIPLPSVLVLDEKCPHDAGEGKDACRWGRSAAPTCKRTTLSQQIGAKKRMGFGAGRGQGEGRLKLLTLKNLDVSINQCFFNNLIISN